MLEHTASCMYSMSRGHLPSKLELVKIGACARLIQLLEHSSKQLRLNSVAALYAISCAGQEQCKLLAQHNPIRPATPMLTPTIGRSAQAGRSSPARGGARLRQHPPNTHRTTKCSSSPHFSL